MTLDGHIKTGLAAAILLLVKLPGMETGMDQQLLPYVIMAFIIGNVGPDFSEFGIIRHRTHTHYPWYYVCFIAIANQFMQMEILADYQTIIWVLMGYSLGCITHIVCDIPYGKIPYFLPNRPMTLCRVPFDSVLNRVIEHSAVVILIVIALTTPEITSTLSQFPDLSAGFLAEKP